MPQRGLYMIPRCWVHKISDIPRGSQDIYMYHKDKDMDMIPMKDQISNSYYFNVAYRSSYSLIQLIYISFL